MEESAQAVEARVEAGHWWFRGRRLLLAGCVRRLRLAPGAPVLDVGSGTGANLGLLRELGCGAVGLDRGRAAAHWCRARHRAPVARGDLAALPFPDRHFELILAADVLEHVDDDAAVLCELRRVLRPGGILLVTVPAFPSLWGLQDEVSHHRRRYRRGLLEARLRAGGFEAEDCFHFNFLLFAPIWLARQLIRLSGLRLASENELNPPWLNAVLERIFRWDVRSAPRLRPPFGVSLLARARRPASA